MSHFICFRTASFKNNTSHATNFTIKANAIVIFLIIIWNLLISNCAVKMLWLLKILAVYILLNLNFKTVYSADISFDRIEILNETYLEGMYNVSLFRITKLNHTVYVFNAEMESFVDMDQFHSVEINFYYNRLNNNQYNRTPMRVKKELLCKIFEKYHDVIIMEATKNSTNVYSNSSGKSCPMKAVNIFNLFRMQFKIDPIVTPCNIFCREITISGTFILIIKSFHRFFQTDTSKPSSSFIIKIWSL